MSEPSIGLASWGASRLVLPTKKRERNTWTLDPSVTADTARPTFNGKPCRRCGSTVRFVALKQRCVRCMKQWRKESRYRWKKHKPKSHARTHPLRKSHGLDRERYDELFALQNGVCAICKKPEVKGRRLSIDHCHRTHSFRGLLCNTCNRALGFFRDSPELLRKAADYLENNGWSL